jgi:periplasmic protein TonB
VIRPILIAAAALSMGIGCAKKASPPPPAPAPTAGGVVGRVGPDGTVRVGGSIREPRKIKHVNPVYPPEARAARIEGVVVIECLIDKQGLVARPTVLRSVPGLDVAALDAVLQWQYEPTLLDGEPVNVIMTVTVAFRLG